MIYIHIFIFLSTILFLSCSDENKADQYGLIITDEKMVFGLDSNTKNELFSYSTYEEDGDEYFVFQAPGCNRILFYDLETQEKKFEIEPSVEGNNGVGFANGYYIHNLDSIYIPSFDLKEIALINRNCEVLDKYDYTNDDYGQELSISSYSAAYLKQIEKIGRNLYIYSGPNRFIEKDPVTVKFNMDNHQKKALPFYYPEYPGSDTKLKKYGLETAFSRCFDGKSFIYSFYYDEKIYKTSIDHSSIQKIPVKSRYINKVKLPEELTAQPQDFCEKPWYGNLLYDKYRNVYYRIAYPQTNIENGINPIELLRFGRKNFSIIILNEDFKTIGETLFPDYTYNSRIILIRKEGIYISDSHYLNPNFTDDVLSFRKFELLKTSD